MAKGPPPWPTSATTCGASSPSTTMPAYPTGEVSNEEGIRRGLTAGQGWVCETWCGRGGRKQLCVRGGQGHAPALSTSSAFASLSGQWRQPLQRLLPLPHKPTPYDSPLLPHSNTPRASGNQYSALSRTQFVSTVLMQPLRLSTVSPQPGPGGPQRRGRGGSHLYRGARSVA